MFHNMFTRSEAGNLRLLLSQLRLNDIPDWPVCAMGWGDALDQQIENLNPDGFLLDPLHVNDKSDGGSTPLHDAVLSGDTTKVLVLLRASADPNIIDINNDTPLLMACLNAPDSTDHTVRMEIIAILITFGASTTACDANGYNAYQRLEASGWIIGQIMFRMFRAVRALLELTATDLRV